jgi:hypothetical protein
LVLVELVGKVIHLAQKSARQMAEIQFLQHLPLLVAVLVDSIQHLQMLEQVVQAVEVFILDQLEPEPLDKDFLVELEQQMLAVVAVAQEAQELILLERTLEQMVGLEHRILLLDQQQVSLLVAFIIWVAAVALEEQELQAVWVDLAVAATELIQAMESLEQPIQAAAAAVLGIMDTNQSKAEMAALES